MSPRVRASRAARWTKRLRSALLPLLMLSAVSLAVAQGRRGRDGGGSESFPNAEYDGRFIFARIAYSEPQSFGFRRGGGPPWQHDYPRAERNFLKILTELSSVRARVNASTIISTDNPEFFRFPVAYMAEPGFWRPTEAEVAGLAAWFKKGGFLIFDDFAGRDFLNMESQMQRVLPGARLVRLDKTHPIFDAFYRIENLETFHPVYGDASEYWGIFEDNDPTKRLIVIANHNNDIAEYWEFADQGFFPIALSNESFKLGINYIVYALSR
jgi:hypothetical protein